MFILNYKPLSDEYLVDETNGYHLHIKPDDYETAGRRTGIRIGTALDLSQLDSISFRAKGEGTLRATFSRQISDDPTYKKVFFKVTLTEEWKDITIDVHTHSDIEYLDVTSWNELSSSVDFLASSCFRMKKRHLLMIFTSTASP